MSLYQVIKTEELTEDLKDWLVTRNIKTARRNRDGSKIVIKLPKGISNVNLGSSSARKYRPFLRKDAFLKLMNTPEWNYSIDEMGEVSILDRFKNLFR